MAQKIKHIAFIIIIIILLLPAVQGIIHIFPDHPLQGDFIPAAKPELTLNSWFDMEYQTAFEPYLEENLGFHNDFIRLNNQLDFSLFNKANAEGVVVGNDGQLFEADYIRAYLGKDFVGYQIIDRKARRIKFLQEHLKREFDIDLVIMLEPGKASVYPEFIPERYDIAGRTTSNYEAYIEKFKEYHVKHIDFNKYFIDIKDTFDYPVFTKNGIHWSIYAMTFAADSMLKYIEGIRNIKMPTAYIGGWEYTDQAQRTDNDVSKTMNLLWEPKMDTMAYPEYKFIVEEGDEKPMVLVVGDSYYWNIFNTRIPKNLFRNEAFWFFYKKVYPDFYFEPTYVSDLNLQQEIEKQDIIILSITERFQYIFDWRFIDNLYNLYAPTSLREPIYRYENDIINFADWFNTIIREARLNEQSIEETLYAEALFAFAKDDPFSYHTLFGIEHVIKSIQDDPDWFQFVKDQAVKKGISTEQSLLDNAEYMFQQNHPEAFNKHKALLSTIGYLKTDSTWLEHTREKADHFHIPLDEMMLIEAEYVDKFKKKN